MAGSKSSSMVVFMVMMVAAMQMHTSMAQTRHVVGDALGWNIPSNDAAAYTTWASGKTFTVGDTLFFNFTTGAHDVAEVAQAAYGPCTTTNPISTATTGPATITLSTPGTHYYICTFGTHCSIGQKVSVNVVSAATAPTPPPAAPPATPTIPPPTATPTPAPVSPPTTTPTPAPAPSPPTPPPTPSPAPSPEAAIPPASPTSEPSPSGSTTPPPAGDNAPTPPSPSSAVRSLVPATLLVAVFALFL